MRICIVTGGTGGHIYPALALVEAFKADDPSHEFLFIGNADRMEAKVIPQAGYAFEPIHTKGIQGNFLDKAYAISTMLTAIPQSLKLLKAFNPEWVIGFGGYVCVPVIMAAKRLKIKTLLHEQNAIVGKANLFLSRYVDLVVSSYASTSEVLPAHITHVLGNPRTFLFKKQHQKEALFEAFKLDVKQPTVLWVMGSLGSESVNAHLGALFELMHQSNIQMVCVTGPKHYDQVLALHDETKQIKIVPYLDQVAWMQVVDLMITRGGATTAAEIMMSGIPSIIIPSPFVPNNHQYHNAKQLFDAHAAVLVEEKNVDAMSLFGLILSLLEDEQRLSQMRSEAKKLAKPQAAQDIIALIKEHR